MAMAIAKGVAERLGAGLKRFQPVLASACVAAELIRR
jgi:hypothetical protein